MACRRKHSLTALLAGTGDAHSFIKELIAYVAEESPAVTIEQARLVPIGRMRNRAIGPRACWTAGTVGALSCPPQQRALWRTERLTLRCSCERL